MHLDFLGLDFLGLAYVVTAIILGVDYVAPRIRLARARRAIAQGRGRKSGTFS